MTQIAIQGGVIPAEGLTDALLSVINQINANFAQVQPGAFSGTFTANGASAVVVSNTNLLATDTVLMSVNTIGGTPAGAPFLSTVTAGTGFQVKAFAGDTSIYNYKIIRNAV